MGQHLPTIDLIVDLVQDRSIIQAVLEEIERSRQPKATRIILNTSSPENESFPSCSLAKQAIGKGIPIVGLQTPLAYTSLINQSDIIISSSESSSRNHNFSRTIVELSKGEVLATIGIQHGYECVGLLHHPTQDIDYPFGVILASDFIISWQPIHQLKSLSPFSYGSIFPCGPISMFLRTSHLLGLRKCQSSQPSKQNNCLPLRVLVCDNSHSPRFRLPTRRSKFLTFCREMNDHPLVDVAFRCHPANRIAVSRKLSNAKQIEGNLDPVELASFDLIISPPSSIVIEAAILGLPTILWSDGVIPNDTINYPFLSVVETANDFISLIKNVGQAEIGKQAHTFAESQLASHYGGMALMQTIENIL